MTTTKTARIRGSSKIEEHADEEASPQDEAPTSDAAIEASVDTTDDAPTIGPPVSKKEEKTGGGSPQIRAIRAAEDASLQAILDDIGPDGSYKIRVNRITPENWPDPKTGRPVSIVGLCNTYAHPIDEEFIRRTYGGGRYVVKFFKQAKDGSFKIFTQRTIDIGGEPIMDDLPRTPLPAGPIQVGAASAAATAAEGTVVKELVGALKGQLDRRDHHEPRGIDPAMQVLLDQMKQQADRQAAEMRELRAELSTTRAQKPPEDPLKDRILSNLIDGESSRIESLRLRYEAAEKQMRDRYEAEADGLKRRHEEDLRRQQDRFDRQLDTVKASFEREIAAVRTANETTLSITKETGTLQRHVLDTDVKRLERDNQELREEIRLLREKKDKGILEQAKDLESLKEALGVEGGGEEGLAAKLVSVLESPAAAEFVKRIMPGAGDAAQIQAAQAQAQAQQRPRVVRDKRSGQTFVQSGPHMVPVVKKPKVIPATVQPDGTVAPEIVMPQVDDARLQQLMTFLSNAFAGGQDPIVVAQSGRSSVPDAIIAWIREHGVDTFISKVAKLPPGSPLLTQAGKNWIRKVGKELTGDTE